MEKKTKVLQVGINSWGDDLSAIQKKTLNWSFLNLHVASEENIRILIHQMKRRTFDVVICTDAVDNSVLEMLSPLIECYSLILDPQFESSLSDYLMHTKIPLFMSMENKAVVLEELSQYFFPGQMGSKIHINNIAVDTQFQGEYNLLGEHRLELKGDFSDFGLNHPLLLWQYNMGMFERSKKIWLEFEHSEGVKLRFNVQAFYDGGSQIYKTWEFDQNELHAGIEIPYSLGIGYLSLSLAVEGKGEVQIGPLHYRDSRAQYGEYILGGEKVSDSQNEEIFYYFHPGDLKPPLTVYFSGYRSAEGFEGFYMMKKLGAPFLLITDPRLEGGSFYLGSQSLEDSLQKVIQDHLTRLNFSNQELILSGLSMGTFGALYYGSMLQPHSIIVGKPLVNLGSMAEKERIIRPGGFPTSLDILQSLTGHLNQKGITELDQRFWHIFDGASFDQTQFVIAYMQDDDYDDKAYRNILEHLMNKNSHVIGKGIAGRHNDNSAAINQWFINHYRRVLDEDFNRGGYREIRN